MVPSKSYQCLGFNSEGRPKPPPPPRKTSLEARSSETIYSSPKGAVQIETAGKNNNSELSITSKDNVNSGSMSEDKSRRKIQRVKSSPPPIPSTKPKIVSGRKLSSVSNAAKVTHGSNLPNSRNINTLSTSTSEAVSKLEDESSRSEITAFVLAQNRELIAELERKTNPGMKREASAPPTVSRECKNAEEVDKKEIISKSEAAPTSYSPTSPSHFLSPAKPHLPSFPTPPPAQPSPVRGPAPSLPHRGRPFGLAPPRPTRDNLYANLGEALIGEFSSCH